MPRSLHARLLAALTTAPLALGVALIAPTSVADAAPAPTVDAAIAVPAVKITRYSKALKIPWDVTWVGSTMLIDERGGKLWSKRYPRTRERVKLTLPRLWTGSEAGLLGLVAAPDAATSKLFYVCAATRTRSGKPKDVRVLRYKLVSPTKASGRGTIISGLPISNGRHSGCRLRFGPDGKLYVGTGDAAQGKNPQNKKSLGGKVLRLNPGGSAPSDNPFYKLGGNAKYVWTYGHRNVQGLAVRPGTSQLWSVEQGTYRDDEVNLIARGANYGYNPVPGYNERVPMTDTRRYPSAHKAKWRSGNPTIATCGGTFLVGSRWGRWEGALVIGALKGKQVRLLRLSSSGRVLQSAKLTAVKKGRIRTVQTGPDGALYITTSNSTGRAVDAVYRITPR